MTDSTPRTSLGELARVFLRLGATAFGGPAAHIAMMEDEIVQRRSWLTRERFLDLLAVSNLLPGPTSTELAIHIGFDRRGWRGLLVAGACFIVPAALIVMALAWVYVEYGALPEARAVLWGIAAVIVAVIAQAVWSLGKTAIKSWQLGVIAAAATAAFALGVHELVVLAIAGVFAGAFAAARRGGARAVVPFVPVAATAVAVPYSLGALALVFLKIGATLFGSGYVLIAYLRADLVERLHWLTEAQLVDAIAIGQVTPGPVFTTATFVGYLLDGPAGACVATAAIFLPAFVFVAASGPLLARIRRSPSASAFLDGVTVASLGLMAWAGVMLGQIALDGIAGIAIAIVAALALIRFKINPTWLVLGGGAIGAVRYFAG